MDISPKRQFDRGSFSKKDIAKATSILLGVDNQTVEIEPTQIRSLCDKFAEIAYSMGETNDLEEYAEEMSESIYGAFKKVERKQQKKKRHR